MFLPDVFIQIISHKLNYKPEKMISFNTAEPEETKSEEITIVIGKPDITFTITDNTPDN